MMLAVRAVIIMRPVGSVRRGVASGFDLQEILVKIGLMGQVQAFLADIEHLVFGSVNCRHVKFNWHSLLLPAAQGALHIIT